VSGRPARLGRSAERGRPCFEGYCRERWGEQDMKIPLLVMVMGCLASCSLSVGAGASARLGRRSGEGGFDCDDFESCDVLYRTAVARARRCHAEDGDCEQEESDVVESYRILRAQTTRELDVLRAREAADAVRREECGVGQ
jgi:hypothetical protein